MLLEARRLVVIGDIFDSRALGPGPRRAVQARIRRLTEGAAGFRVTAGDEFEWPLDDAPESLDRALLLRATLACAEGDAPGVQLRLALGRGAVWVHDEPEPYAQDGPAYHRARAAMRRLTEAAGQTRRRHVASPYEPGHIGARYTGFEDGRADPVREALLAHMDHLISGWSVAQWEAIAGSLGGDTYETVGERLGVTPQAVAARLRAARIDLYLTGHAALKATWADRDAPSAEESAGGAPR